MKIKNVQRVLFLLIFFLFANHAWAEDWILCEVSGTGNRYYDKSSIKKVSNDIVSIWTIKVYNNIGKAKDFLMLTKENKAPKNVDILNCNSMIVEFDCKKNKFRISAWTIYDKEKKALFSAPNSMFQWKDVIAKSTSEELKKIVCKKQ